MQFFYRLIYSANKNRPRHDGEGIRENKESVEDKGTDDKGERAVRFLNGEIRRRYDELYVVAMRALCLLFVPRFISNVNTGWNI